MSKITDYSELHTYSSEITSANILEVETGTTGYHGGDNGCVTYFRLRDKANTGFRHLRVFDTDSANGSEFTDFDGFELTLEGDTELNTFLHALEFTVDVLKSQITLLSRREVLVHDYDYLLPVETVRERTCEAIEQRLQELRARQHERR